jgi:hypothetical protein
MSALGRPKRDFWSAQHEGSSANASGRSQTRIPKRAAHKAVQ